MELQGRDYREILRNELAKRQDKNPRYSLRAFAKALKVNPTTLSLVLQNKRGLSESSIEKIVQSLGLDPQQARIFRALVLSVDGETPEIRLRHIQELEAEYSQTKNREPYCDLSLSMFRVIADWYNLAILELLNVEQYKKTDTNIVVQWIADQLDLTTVQVKSALDRLEQLELIEYVEGKPARTEGILRTGDKSPSEAIRSHHRQYIERSLAAIQEQEFDECDFSGIIVPVDVSQLPEAKKAIQEFRKKMNHLLRGSSATEVYRLSVSLFNLTKGK